MKIIPGFPGYKADENGYIWSFKRYPSGKKLKLRMHNNYWEVELYVNNSRKYTGAHRLVCLAFHGMSKKGQETRHLNGKTQDNRQCNLKWGTSHENMQDRIFLGTQLGASNGNAKLTEEIVLKIRDRDKTTTNAELAKKYSIDPSTISNVLKRKTWRHISDKVKI